MLTNQHVPTGGKGVTSLHVEKKTYAKCENGVMPLNVKTALCQVCWNLQTCLMVRLVKSRTKWAGHL